MEIIAMSEMIFCWGCGKEIHSSAQQCPHCGATQKRRSSEYIKYSDVPWYRRNWFAILTFFFLAPLLFLIAVTGDIYYKRKGEIRRYGALGRVFLALISFIPFVLSLVLLGGAGL